MADEAAQLRGLAQFMRDVGPLVFGHQRAEQLHTDLIGQSLGDDPILGRGIAAGTGSRRIPARRRGQGADHPEGLLLRRDQRHQLAGRAQETEFPTWASRMMGACIGRDACQQSSAISPAVGARIRRELSWSEAERKMMIRIYGRDDNQLVAGVGKLRSKS